MEYPESTAQAVALLKQALPRMMQHQLAPNPINYALWYHHVDQRDPALSGEIERLLQSQGSYSAQQAWSMFQRHLLAVDQGEQQRALVQLHALAARLLHRLGDSLSSSASLDDELQRAAAELATAGDTTDLQQIAALLNRSVDTLTQANQQFRHQMEGTRQQMEQLRGELEQARDAADRDPLTKLLNRQAFEREFQRLRNTGDALTLLFCDIDHFKRFNDEHGHATGDAVLVLVAQTTFKCLRPSDLAVRYGGEEILVILPETPLEGARVAAERVRAAVHSSKLPGLSIGISVSIGAATLGEGEVGEALIKRADERLYLAKERGRNRVES